MRTRAASRPSCRARTSSSIDGGWRSKTGRRCRVAEPRDRAWRARSRGEVRRSSLASPHYKSQFLHEHVARDQDTAEQHDDPGADAGLGGRAEPHGQAARVGRDHPLRGSRSARADQSDPRSLEGRSGRIETTHRGLLAPRTCARSSSGPFRPCALQRGLELAVDRAVGAGVGGDRSSAPRQILKNLLSNAFKFTEQGGVELRIDRRRAPPSARGAARAPFVAIAVRDTGIGVPSEHARGSSKPSSKVIPR